MNVKLILRITGVSLLVEAGALLFPLGVSLYYHEDPVPFLLTICILLAVGLGPALLLRPQRLVVRPACTGNRAIHAPFSSTLIQGSYKVKPASRQRASSLPVNRHSIPEAV